jgi:DNA-binding NarL/FixJ family response regulator
VLLAESGTEDILFLREVLDELHGARHWTDWVQLETSYAATCADAAAILATESVDILLLDPDLPDSQGAETFRHIQAAAPHVPVILLTEPSAIPLAERLIREGAQDFLLKGEVDCVPLARAMRKALERHRLITATRSTSMTDALTALLTRPAFLTLAGRDWLLAQRLNRKLMILLAEPRHQDSNSQQQDLILVEMADGLRHLAGAAALISRLSPSRFAIAVLDTEAEPLAEITCRFEEASRTGNITFAAALFDPDHPLSLDALLEQADAIMAESADRSRCHV